MTGTDIIKQYEGCKLAAYLCPAGVATIGYGSTKGVKLGMVITMEQALSRLQEDINEAQAGIKKLVKVPLNENQLGALTSFVFNLGSGALAKSTLLKKLNTGDYQGAADEFSKWVNAGGKQLPGLVKRRAAERELFLA